MSLHRILRKRRIELGLQQKQIAPLLGICTGHVSRLERGTFSPPLKRLLKWCAALDMDIRIKLRPRSNKQV